MSSRTYELDWQSTLMLCQSLVGVRKINCFRRFLAYGLGSIFKLIN